VRGCAGLDPRDRRFHAARARDGYGNAQPGLQRLPDPCRMGELSMTSKSSGAHITFISAGAGSGKTYRLTELLHRELTAGSVRPSGVIATTFTKKAATELR